jgi:peptidoglycan hydrolase-like protein with peptidoglycan-binding domain
MDMEDIKSIIFGIIVLGLLGLGGYWAFSTMESGSSHIDKQKLEELENENQELKNEVSKLNSEISTLTLQKEEVKKVEVVQPAEEVAVEKPVTKTTTKTPLTTISKNQTLINELQKLVNGNVSLKKGSTGTQVGTVQKFLNIYNKTSNKVDNDYGNTTITIVKAFQKAQGLTADGEAGSTTFKKMITWLNSH